MNDTTMYFVGRLAADPTIRFTQSGNAVVSFRLLNTPRVRDRVTNEWRDGETVAMNVSAWRQLAENVTESLKKGDLAFAVGRLKSRSYETAEGEKRTVLELEADEVGAALSRATAKVTRNTAGGGSGFTASAPSATASQDPWAGGGFVPDDFPGAAPVEAPF